MPIEPKTILVFCAHEQKETEHTLDIDGAGEIVLTCGCGRFLKFPKGTTAEDLKGLLEKHKASNAGQISVEAMEAQKAELLAELGGASSPSVPE